MVGITNYPGCFLGQPEALAATQGRENLLAPSWLFGAVAVQSVQQAAMSVAP